MQRMQHVLQVPDFAADPRKRAACFLSPVVVSATNIKLHKKKHTIEPTYHEVVIELSLVNSIEKSNKTKNESK